MIAPGVLWRFLGCMALLAAPWIVAAHIAPRNGLPLAVLMLAVLAILFIPTRAQAASRRAAERALETELRMPIRPSPKPPHPRDCA